MKLRKTKVQTDYLYVQRISVLRIRVNYINQCEGVSVFSRKQKKIDINVDTTSSTRNFGCISIRSGVTYLPKCTMPAILRRDSTDLPVTKMLNFPSNFISEFLVYYASDATIISYLLQCLPSIDCFINKEDFLFFKNSI